MKGKSIIMILYVGIMPLQNISISPDSLDSHISVLGGLGKYVYIHQGCGSEIYKERIPFREFSISYEKKKEGTRHTTGINTGSAITQEDHHTANSDDEDIDNDIPLVYAYVNPYVRTEWKYFAYGLGLYGMGRYSIRENAIRNRYFGLISVYLRAGNLQSVYSDISIFNTPPIFAGGYLKGGIGVGLIPNTDLWFGMGTSPFEMDRCYYILRANYRINPKIIISSFFSYGEYKGLEEGSMNIGVIYNIHR